MGYLLWGFVVVLFVVGLLTEPDIKSGELK